MNTSVSAKKSQFKLVKVVSASALIALFVLGNVTGVFAAFWRTLGNGGMVPNPSTFEYGYGYGNLGYGYGFGYGFGYGNDSGYYAASGSTTDAYANPLTVSGSNIGSVSTFSGASITSATLLRIETPVSFSGTGRTVVLPADTDITSNTATFDATALRLAVITTAPVTLESQFSYEGGMSFGVDGLKLNFSKPIKLQIPVTTTNPTVEILVKHATLTNYSTAALTNNPSANCSNGVATPQSNVATVSNGVATIYTCSASTFVAVTSPTTTTTSSGAPLPIASGNSGGGGGGSVFTPISNTTTTTTTGSTTTALKDVLTDKQVKFRDISDSWAKSYIVKLAKKGIINNTTAYNPERSLTRAEFLKIAIKAAGYQTSSAKTSFSDVSSTDWFAPYVAVAVEKNIISSTNKNFRPNDTITRAEVAKIMVGIMGATASNVSSTDFSDVSSNDDLAKYIQKATELGVFNGQTIDGKKVFRPADSITRAEIAKVVVNALKL